MRTLSVRKRDRPAGLATLDRPRSEQDALAAMLLEIKSSPAQVAKAAAALEPEMFADPIRREIMHALKLALRADQPCVAEVAAAIRREAAAAGNDPAAAIAALVELTEVFVGADPIRTAELAGQEVREAHAGRMAANALALGLERIRAGQPTASDLAEIGEDLGRAQQLIGRAGNDSSSGLLAVLDHWAKNESRPAVPTLFSPIDDRLDGGLPIGLTAIAAPPGHGKSALAMQCTLGALLADPDATAIWFRGEMTNDQLAARMLAVWSCLRGGLADSATRRDAKRRTAAARRVAIDLANVVGDRLTLVNPPLTPAVLEQAIVAHKPRLAVLDYLQRAEVAGKADRRAEIEEMLRTLDRVAIANEVAVIVVSSMAKATGRDSEIGTLSKETNQLDYDVQSFLALWGGEDREADPRPVRLAIKKARDGGEGVVDLLFSGSSQYFTPADMGGQLAESFSEFNSLSPERLG